MRAAKEAVAPMVTKQVLGEEEVAIGGGEAVCSKGEREREGEKEGAMRWWWLLVDVLTT